MVASEKFSLKFQAADCKYTTKYVFSKIFAKFTGKHECWSLIFNKVADLRCIILLKKRLQHRHFPVNFAKFIDHLHMNAPEKYRQNS